MPRLLVSEASAVGGSGVIGLDSKLWRYRATEVGVLTASEPLEMIIPSGTSGVRKRPSWADYNLLTRSRKYGFGAWTSNIVVDENFRVLRSGIPAPPMVPTVAAVAGPGVTNTSVCYLRFVDDIGERLGPLSAATPNVVLANQQRQWSSLPTTCVDPSVNCIEGVIAVDGFLPRVAWRRQMGVTTVTEAIATGALGEAPDEFTEFPLCEIGAIWRDRLAGSGNQQYPERVFLTDIADLEQYAGLFLQTEGEPCNGMFFSNENFFFGSKKRIYRAAGFEVTDIVRDPEKPDIGLIGHHGIVNMHGVTIVPTNLGFYLFNGGWQYLMKDRAAEWFREYKFFRDEYESAAAIFDPVEGLYKFGPVPHSEIPDKFVYWTIDGKRLVPDIAQAQLSPVIANDARARLDAGSAVLYIPGGSAQAEVVTGSWDGKLRRENEETDGTDDGDSYVKKLTIEPATEVVDPGGAYQTDGTTWKRAWNFIRTRLETTFTFFTGTEFVTESTGPGGTPGYPDVVGEDLDLLSEPNALTDHPLDGMTGEGICMRVTVDGAKQGDLRWSGWGGLSGPGLRVRGGLNPE
jgi:hypothetical protein